MNIAARFLSVLKLKRFRLRLHRINESFHLIRPLVIIVLSCLGVRGLAAHVQLDLRIGLLNHDRKHSQGSRRPIGAKNLRYWAPLVSRMSLEISFTA